MANFGLGFGEALFKNHTAEKNTEIQEMRMELEKGELGFRLADLADRRDNVKQQAIRQEYLSAVEGMKTFAETVEKLGPNFVTGSALDRAIDRQKNIVAAAAKLAGIDPEVGQAMADRVRALAKVPQRNVIMSPGQEMRDPITGAPIASVPQAPGEFERKVAVMERQLGRRLTPQELTQMGGAAGTATQAQSPAGKMVADRQMFVAQYGADSPQVKAFDEASAAGDVKLDDVGSMRKEFTAQSKDFVTIRDSFGKVAEAAANPSAAGDLSLIFGFMKMLDPASTVREGEFANAQNAAGIPDRVVNMYNRALRGERLNDEQRSDFTKQAERVFKVQLNSQLKNEEQYRGLAKRNKMREEDVVIDFVGPYRKATKPAKPAGGGGGAKPDDDDPLGLRGGKK